MPNNKNISFGENEPSARPSANSHLPTIKSEIEPTESKYESEFRAIRPEAQEDDKKSNRSFAEEVEREIQEFKAKKEQMSRAGSKASDSQGNMQRGRPRESEIDKIVV